LPWLTGCRPGRRRSIQFSPDARVVLSRCPHSWHGSCSIHREEAMPFYERGPVRIHYEERGSGLPLMVIPGGGLNSTIAGLDATHPFNAAKEFSNTFRTVVADLRNAV